MNDLKTFYRLDQAAKELNDIAIEDILRLALDGHLTLSVKLIKSPIWELGERVENLDPLWHSDSWTIIGSDYYRFGYLRPETKLPNEPLDLIIDSGNVRVNLEQYCYDIGANASNIRFLLEGAILQRGANDFTPINPETGNSNFTRPNAPANGKYEKKFSIPEDGYLVITKANLDAFKTQQANPATSMPARGKVYGLQKRSAMAKPIDDIRRQSEEPNNKIAIWEALKALALSKNPPVPIVGYADDEKDGKKRIGIQYRGTVFDNDSEYDIYTKRALQAYIDRNPFL